MNLVAHSTATLKLHTKRYRLATIEREYWVLVYRLLYPDIALWRIGDSLQVASQHKVRDVNGAIMNKLKQPLNAVTGRYYYKARFTLLNLERDSFPNNSAIEVSSRKQPFGTEHQKEFRAATEDEKNGEPCVWMQWLRNTYLTEIKEEVVHHQRIHREMRLPDSKVRQRIDAFIAGESDLLK